MATLAQLVVIKRNGKVQPYPTRELIECESMEGVVSLANGHTRFTSLNQRVIPVQYEVEQTLSQIKALCNKCCSSTSAS